MALSIADSHNDGNADGDDCSPTGMYKSPQPSTRLDLLQDMDIPSSSQLNQVMSTVFFPTMTSSQDIFRFNKFDRWTININYTKQLFIVVNVF